MTEWEKWDRSSRCKDGNIYDVKLKDGDITMARFDNYTDSLGDEPDWWVILRDIKIGNKMRTIRYVLGKEVEFWKIPS